MTIVIFAAYLALNIYVWSSLDGWLRITCERYSGKEARDLTRSRIILAFCLAVPFSFAPAGSLLPPSEIRNMLQAVGNLWLGIGGCIAGILLLGSLYRIIRFGPRRKRASSDQELRRTGIAVLVLAVAVSAAYNIYGVINALDVKQTEYNVEINKSVNGLDKLDIVYISDFHIDCSSHKGHMKDMVSKVNKQDPDLILMGGDVITSDMEAINGPDAYAEIFSQLKAKYGIYGCYGNHDVEEPLFLGFSTIGDEKPVRTGKIDRFFDDCGFTMLGDQTARICDGRIQIVSRLSGEKIGEKDIDERMTAGQVMNGIDRTKPTIVLEHEPGDYKELAACGADLVLSGHTHDGQTFPANILTSLLEDLSYGRSDKYGMTAIVSSGVGYYGPPVRVGTKSEYVVIHMTFK